MNKKYKYLDLINFPSDIKKLPQSELRKLADEVREELIDAVSETGVPKRALNNSPPNFIRHVYVNNQSASNGSLTESFIRSRASLSPSYFHNEIVSRYNMISSVPKNLTQLKKSIYK